MKHNWTEHSKYESLDDADDFLHAEGFVLFDDKDLKCGQKFYYRCNRIPKDRKRLEWCARRFIVFLPSDSRDIILQTNGENHSHNELLKNKHNNISPEMRNFINDLYKMETKRSSSIWLHLNDARERHHLFIDEPNPSKRQLEYCLKKFNCQGTGKMIHLGDMAKWCDSKSNHTECVDDAFVLAHEIFAEKEKQGFRFCMSTPNLLEQLSKVSTIAIDATYKLNWMGFPLIILGTVDRQKKIHPMIYACASHETTDDYIFVLASINRYIGLHFPESKFAPKIMIADGAHAIKNAFFTVFKHCAEVLIMCFAHVIRNVRKRPFTSKNNKHLIIEDIKKMQLASNKGIFEMMTKLFREKWLDTESNFVEYFEKEWLGSHSNWFEGAAQYTPSTNNALESHNATIKRNITFRRRLPLEEFLIAMTNMTANVSKQFSEGLRIVASKPNISREVIMRAAEIENNGLTAFKATSKNGGIFYVIPSEKCLEDDANLKYYKSLAARDWKSFDEFITYGQHIFWIVKFSNDVEWDSKSSCTCPIFFKQHICKHIVAIAMHRKIMDCPQSANPILIAPRKKPGRTKNATMSLMR